jgi:hypothetical protein
LGGGALGSGGGIALRPASSGSCAGSGSFGGPRRGAGRGRGVRLGAGGAELPSSHSGFTSIVVAVGLPPRPIDERVRRAGVAVFRAASSSTSSQLGSTSTVEREVRAGEGGAVRRGFATPLS